MKVLKTNISKIMKYVVKEINDMGFNVTINYSRTTKTRYLEIELPDEIMKVRISDHASENNEHKFDIHTTKKRKDSVNYEEFLEVFKEKYGKHS